MSTSGDEVKLGQLPTLAGYDAWRNVIFQNVDLASRREDNKAMLWIQEVEMLDTVTDEQLMEEPQNGSGCLTKRWQRRVKRSPMVSSEER